MFSIDQNCHSLWDVVPKLQALARRGVAVRHFVEDVDVAFTQMGAGPDGGELRLARERFYRSGGGDWGAAMFYADFLGAQPTEIREWERWTGMKTNVLARKLARSVDDLYNEFSPGGTWQLIGPSYVGDRNHHRVIGDLKVAEIAPLLRELLDKAAADMRACFPDADAQSRVEQMFHVEHSRAETLLADHAAGTLTELYAAWMSPYCPPPVELDAASSLFALDADPCRTALLEVFLRDYDAAAGLYNEAISSANVGLRTLRIRDGELPFFAVLDHDGHAVRTGVFLDEGNIRIGERTYPLTADRRLPIDALQNAGVRSLAGKAALLVIQVRIGPNGRPLVLPYQGSLYLPAADELQRRLDTAGLLPAPVKPIIRLRFRVLDRIRELDTTLRLPQHLHRAFGRQEMTTREFADSYRDVANEAAERLASFETPDGREQWQRRNCSRLLEDIARLNAKRRSLAEVDATSPEIREVHKTVRTLETDLLDRTLRQIACDAQAARIDYWDSRGALLPWCVALGGEAFYNDVIANAEIYEEPAP
jgi:hypothetical protein